MPRVRAYFEFFRRFEISCTPNSNSVTAVIYRDLNREIVIGGSECREITRNVVAVLSGGRSRSIVTEGFATVREELRVI